MPGLRATSLCLAFVLLSATAFSAQTPQHPPAKPNSPDETCVLTGLVVAKLDNSPLKNATVSLRNSDDSDHTIATKTTSDGRFELKNIPAGQYHLSVWRNGYSRAEYGQEKPGDPGATLTLRSGQNVTDLQFKLARWGVLTGRVFDEDGEPMPFVRVNAQKLHYENGRRSFQVVGQTASNDLGEFRLFDLAPGRYYLSAEEQTWYQFVMNRQSSSDSQKPATKGHTKIYYPNAIDMERASPVLVKEGEEIPKIDFLMREVPVFSVRGRVVNQISKSGHGINVDLVHRQGNSWSDVASGRAKGDGSFELPEVASGEYTLLAILFEDGKVYAGEVDVDVSAADVEGLVVPVTLGANLPGRVRWEGKSAPAATGDISVTFETETLSIGRTSARVDQHGEFVVKEVPDGTYRVVVMGLSKDSYIKEVKLGGDPLPDTEFHLRGAAGNLEITINTDGAMIAGSVLTADDLPATGAWVVAVPEESRRKLQRLYKFQSTDQYGHFELHGLAPGKYKLFSWQGIEQSAWQDADFLKPYEDKGQDLEVKDGDKKSADLHLIPANDTDAKTD